MAAEAARAAENAAEKFGDTACLHISRNSEVTLDLGLGLQGGTRRQANGIRA
jgi:hypothetical protein